MITFSKFGNYGRLGNQLFQYASLIGLGEIFGKDVVLPKCDFAEYLENKPNIKCISDCAIVQEKHYHYDVEQFNVDGNIDIVGWLQSEKYWQHCKEKVRKALRFNSKKCNELYQYQQKFFGKQSIAISVRRGDYVDNPNYAQLGADYYYLAMMQHIPNWQDCNILIFSDDIEYCKVHFECLPNVHFIEDLHPMQQLIVGSSCDHFIIGNSTFSWWLAYLGEKEHSKVIRPNYLFEGNLLKQNDSKDFYPERWINYDHINLKIDLKDTTFIIPVSIDSTDRIENINTCIAYINTYFDTNIIIGEQGTDAINHSKVKFNYPKFHRTKMLNEMTKQANTPIVINYDADVFLPPLQIWLAVHYIRTNVADYVYPYDGQFARVGRGYYNLINDKKDLGRLSKYTFKGTFKNDVNTPKSVGGAIAFNKEAYTEIGLENERFISYAPEDIERFYRMANTGRLKRIKGVIYHLDHEVTINSSIGHVDYANNVKVCNELTGLTMNELWRLIRQYQ
jgi:hypothetical protein